jgi:glucan 1,3-beta-glucosidase
LFLADNSGEALPYTTCQVWLNNGYNINRSLDIIRGIAQAILDDGVADVVTGLGLLNEPFADCTPSNYKHFVQEGMNIVRSILGKEIAVYVSDMFQANIFNDGHWWIDPKVYNNTYLDSHYYQVFDSTTRDLSPRQHIAYTCTNHYRRTTSCCYKDGPNRNHFPSHGVSRMIGEWSASMDILPSARINDVINSIVKKGIAPYLDRQFTDDRKEFLRNYIQAQIVTYEAANHPGLSKAWFYWTIKMEGGAFMEWDMLRGIQDGWFPNIVDDSSISSESMYGTCYDIMWRTDDNRSVILEEYPDPMYLPPETDPMKIIDDDIVLSHGESLMHPQHHSQINADINTNDYHHYRSQNFHQAMNRFIHHHLLFIIMIIMLLLLVILSVIQKRIFHYQKRSKYCRIDSEISMTV